MSEGDWKGGTTGSSSGRFPANLILQHTPNCVKVGTKTVGSGERRDAKDGNSKPFDDGRGWNSPPMTRGGATAPENYGTETVDDWNCSDTCPVRHLDEQTGQLYSSDHRRANTHGIGGVYDGRGSACITTGYEDDGGASRFFYNATSPDDLTTYLRRLRQL